MDDEAVVAAYLRSRAPELFRGLVERYQSRVFRLVASLLGPYADLDAQEVTQEVLLRAHDKLDTFRGESRFGTWLYRLAYNRALERRRRARLRLPHLPVDALAERAGPSDPFRALSDAERRRAVGRWIEQLPELYRSVIYLHYWMESSVEEIAETLAVPPGTVKSYLFRARRRLRDRARAEGIR